MHVFFPAPKGAGMSTCMLALEWGQNTEIKQKKKNFHSLESNQDFQGHNLA